MGWGGWLGFALLAAWLLAATICQVQSPLERRIRSFDYAGLIPYWSFFAPQPGVWDYRLVYRDRLADGSITRWTEIEILDPRRPWHALWNPRRREKKAFHDLVTQLMRESRDTRPEGLILTVPYLMLLNWVSSLPRPSSASGTQFAIVFDYGATSDEAAQPAVVSAMHPL